MNPATKSGPYEQRRLAPLTEPDFALSKLADGSEGAATDGVSRIRGRMKAETEILKKRIPPRPRLSEGAKTA